MNQRIGERAKNLLVRREVIRPHSLIRVGVNRFWLCMGLIALMGWVVYLDANTASGSGVMTASVVPLGLVTLQKIVGAKGKEDRDARERELAEREKKIEENSIRTSEEG